MEYSEMYMRLNEEVATIIFAKKNGDIRVMLATRNIRTASIYHENMLSHLAAYDKRSNISNNNMAVVDLALGETRTFSMQRLCHHEFHGEITTAEQLDELYNKFREFKKEYEASMPQRISMGTLLD